MSDRVINQSLWLWKFLVQTSQRHVSLVESLVDAGSVGQSSLHWRIVWFGAINGSRCKLMPFASREYWHTRAFYVRGVGRHGTTVCSTALLWMIVRSRWSILKFAYFGQIVLGEVSLLLSGLKILILLRCCGVAYCNCWSTPILWSNVAASSWRHCQVFCSWNSDARHICHQMICSNSLSQLLLELVDMICARGHQKFTDPHFWLLEEFGGLARRLVVNIFKTRPHTVKIDLFDGHLPEWVIHLVNIFEHGHVVAHFTAVTQVVQPRRLLRLSRTMISSLVARLLLTSCHNMLARNF